MSIHKTVLLKEAVAYLNLKKGDVVVDATLGGGGHSREILKAIGEEGKLIAIDRDAEAIEKFKMQNAKLKIEKLLEKGNLILVNDNFSNLKNILESLNIKKTDSVLADFGLSSDQLDSNERGFSFLLDADLDMRMERPLRNTNSYEITNEDNLTAKEIVNNYSKEDLIRIFREYGEEKYAAQIARKIEEIRREKEIKNTSDLVEIIAKSVPEIYKHKKIHFATRVFQALRIEVNNELESIEKFANEAVEALIPGGRLAVISFHSGEDRIAKNIFKNLELDCVCPPEFPVCRCEKESKIKIITKRPIVASEEEITENPRSRSAKMRVVEKK